MGCFYRDNPTRRGGTVQQRTSERSTFKTAASIQISLNEDSTPKLSPHLSKTRQPTVLARLQPQLILHTLRFFSYRKSRYSKCLGVFTRRRGANTAHTQMGRPTVHTRHLLESTHTITNNLCIDLSIYLGVGVGGLGFSPRCRDSCRPLFLTNAIRRPMPKVNLTIGWRRTFSSGVQAP